MKNFTNMPGKRGVSILRTLSAPTGLKKSTLAFAVASSLVGTAYAQDSAQNNDRVEEITVEGSMMDTRALEGKLTGSILNTPKSITVLSSEQIQERGASSLVEALKSVPGITFNAGEGGQPAGDNLKIRGFDAGADVFVDGVRDAGSQTRDIFALEQVEVLMGPGSSYTGRGSTGGSVNLSTKSPLLEDSLSMRIGGGNEDYQRVAVDGNYQIQDNAAVRLNVLYHEGDVPGRDSVYYSRKGVAPSIAFGIDTDTQVALDYYYYRTDDMPDYSIPYSRNAGNTSSAGEPVAVDRNNFYGLLNRDFQKTGSDIASIKIQHQLTPQLSISNTTRLGTSSNDYVVTNPDDSRGNVFFDAVLRNTKNRNSETETKANLTNLSGILTLGGMEHSFSAGLEISTEEMYNNGYSITSTNPFGSPAGADFANSCSAPGAIGAGSNYNCTSLSNPNPNDPWMGTVEASTSFTLAETDTRSVYFLDTVTIDPNWLLNVGLRFDDYETTQESFNNFAGLQNVENNSSFWNYQLGVVYKPSEQSSIYLSTGTSSNPSGNTLGDGTENISAGNEDLEPETNQTYELGVKWLLADGLVSIQSAVFQTIKDNARVSIEPGRGAPQETVGEQTLTGFELGVNGQITEKWSMTASYTFLDSELTDDGPIATNEGNAFPNTPENSFNLWTTYAVTPQILVGAGANYVDQRFGNTANTIWIPEYTTYDMMASYQVNQRMGFQLNIQNLTDETYFTRPYAAHYAAIGPARSVVLSFSYDM